MKAPNKIYLTKGDPNDSIDFDTDVKYGSVMWEQFRLTDYDVEYIRKEALTEWLKEKIRDYWANDENTMGIYPYALEEVIEKLNSL